MVSYYDSKYKLIIADEREVITQKIRIEIKTRRRCGSSDSEHAGYSTPNSLASGL